jgi:transcriptional regulator with XRE-family HTH domain
VLIEKEVLLTAFGDALRAFRQASNDAERLDRRLSQERLGILIGEEMGDRGFTGAAISDWERGESKINAEDRNVLLALIKVLHQCRGLKTLVEANHFLELGNYRPLDANEAGKIFVASPPEPEQDKNPKSSILFLLENILAVSEKELQALIDKARAEGPDPWWPRAFAALMRKATDRLSLSLRTILWVWTGLIAWWSVGPSLRLPFANQDIATQAMVCYAAGTLMVPLMIGALVNTKDNAYWKENGLEKSMLLRLYTHQGAGIGFNLGYFFVFPFSLARHYLQLGPSVWVEIAAVLLGLVLGNMGARVVPHNLWRAYGRLAWADGAIFFVVALMGPLWAFFLLELYPILLNPVTGVVVFLLAITIMVVMATRKSKNHDK